MWPGIWLEDSGKWVWMLTVDDSAPRTGSDTGNIMVRVPGNTPGPTVMLCAHMDTIGSTEGMVPVLRDGVIYSNGKTVLGADDKAGIAIILSVLADLKGGGVPHPDLEVLFTVQEEVGLVGAKHLHAELKAAFGYILDGDGPVGNIINQTPVEGGSRSRSGGKGGPCRGLSRGRESMPSSLRPRPSPASAPDASTAGRLRMWARSAAAGSGTWSPTGRR